MSVHERFNRFDASFGGVPLAQYWADLYLWEMLLNGVKPVKVIELGTWKGAMALYLQAQCKIRGIKFVTYDVVSPGPIMINIDFRKLDIFLEKDQVLKEIHLSAGPIILFVDNGNKPRELQLFTRDLPEGSLVVAHDWMTEVMPSDVPDWLEEVNGELCDELGSASRCFINKGDEVAA